jgi:hypothetical protein
VNPFGHRKDCDDAAMTKRSCEHRPSGASIHLSLFFSFPRGMTKVTGGVGRSEGDDGLGALVSFFGFLLIFSLRCSLPMVDSSHADLYGGGRGRRAAAWPDLTMVAASLIQSWRS